MFLCMNKRGDLAILILVIGITILCIVSLMSFYFVEKKKQINYDSIYKLK